MIAIMGGSGNTGRAVAEGLLRSGEKVRVLGRSAERLAPLAAAGAEILTGSASDAGHLAAAFRGADAVYALIPPNPQAPDYRAEQDCVGEAIARAFEESGTPYGVFLSSVGADRASGTGPIAGLHAAEERLRRTPGLNLLVLRPGYFFENAFHTLGLIRHQGVNGGAIDPDLRMPMIATRDIAEFAARALRARDWRGFVIRELLGPRDLTPREVTGILGRHIGRPDLPYVRFADGDFRGALLQQGFSASMADLYVEMCRAFNEGKVASREGRRPENTTPTDFEQFAEDLAVAYRSV